MGKWSSMESELNKIREDKLFRVMTIFESAQTAKVIAEGNQQQMFSSNNYLDLCNNRQIKAYVLKILEKYGAGSGGARLTTGTTREHIRLEQTLAKFKDREAALVFNTGYMANTGVLSAIAQKGDVIFSDERNHASIIDGCRLAKADLVIYRHNDMKDLERKVKEHPGCRGVIVSDGVFSMDGDIVNLPELIRIAEQYQLLSMLDEAHATGVIGAAGRGTEEYYGMEGSVDILMGTLSKAVGSEGGFVCGSRLLIDYLKNKARSFIFSTALSPLTAAASKRGIELIMEEPERVWRLQENIRFFCQALSGQGIAAASETAIVPVIIGDEGKAMEIMAQLKEKGYFISAIRYPTVKKGTARLRITLMSSHTREDLTKLADTLAQLLPDPFNNGERDCINE